MDFFNLGSCADKPFSSFWPWTTAPVLNEPTVSHEAARSRNRIPGRIRTRGYPRITPAPTRKTLETIGPDPGTPAVPPEGPGAVYTQSPTRECPRFALKDPARPA